jgi:hypothetical protein
LGFITNNPKGNYSLKIQLELLDIKTGEFKTSYDPDKFRVELSGINTIQEYCKTNNLELVMQKFPSSNVTIMKKNDVFLNDKPVRSADFDDFNFRVTYKNEESVSKNGKVGMELLSNWNKSKKQFRYINRVSFTKEDSSMQIDMSIVKSSSKDDKGRLIKTYNIQESNVFQNPETYEIEIEVKTNDAKIMHKTPESLTKELENMSKIILSGLQKTNYPISYSEQKKAIIDYMLLIHTEDAKKRQIDYVPKDRVYPSNFIGPSSKTLQIKNIASVNPDMTIPNITIPYSYCVTDKADGDRHMLFINNVGRIYLINTNMSVIFTGARTEEEKCFNSLLDGELILHDKKDNYINTFAVFDIYFINNLDIRASPFVAVPTKEDKYFEEGCRLPILKEFVKLLDPISVTVNNVNNIDNNSKFQKLMASFKKEYKSPITIITKNFYPNFVSSLDKDSGKSATDSYNIFGGCNYILQRIKDGLYDYNTDGLIFTPTLLGVGSNKFLEAGPLKKVTWEYSFKWKPAQFNTIDFLITTKKGPDGKDIITPIFENGINVYNSTQFNQYKTVILRVGFDEKKHGYINPCQDVLDDKILEYKDSDNNDTYKPTQFFPTDPYDPQAGLCNVMLELDSAGNYQLFTEERQVFEDNTVVEFRYDINREGLWKWIPLRVRYDKTAEYRQGLNSFGNDYKTADNNWYSIHNPITEKMISTGQDIPEEILSDDIYYNRVTTEKLTPGLRDFHNLVVKKTLIQSVSKRGNTLIDYACGKGGDFPKWISSNLSFVFGIDISKDNIENRLNGACARYLTFKKDFKKMPDALFVNGNSSLNIRSGKAMFSDKANLITESVFGNINPDKKLGSAVVRLHGKGRDGFDVSSCQFAVHYMFQNKKIFYNFMRNIAECTKLNGYFIGTSYDGKSVFNLLRKKLQGEMVEIYTDDKKVWSLVKDYDNKTMEDNDSCLGYQISVYQDSINQVLPEYLVNYDFLNLEMEKYGFVLVPRDEAKAMGLPESSGMFIELYNMMMNEIKRNPNKAKDYGEASLMKTYEKNISFLNRYFVFKKIRTINAEKLTAAILSQLPDEIEFERMESILAEEAVKNADEIIKPKSRKLGKKLLLQEATEALDEDVVDVKKKVRKPRKVGIKPKLIIEEEEEKEMLEGEKEKEKEKEVVENILEEPPVNKAPKKQRAPRKKVALEIIEEENNL